MADKNLSDDGIKNLKGYEGVIDGLYDDSSGYCTFGVGHLVHPEAKWKCFLLEAAKTDDTWKKKVQNVGGTSLKYLPKGTVNDDNFTDLKTNAIGKAKDTIAQKKYTKAFDNLSKEEKEKVTAAAEDAVAEQAKILAKQPNDVFKEDLKPYEKAVGSNIKTNLTQNEFDAAVSLCFNIGASAFSTSSVVKEINRGKYKEGNAKERKAAIQAIETAFGLWNKSKGLVNDGLTKRRNAEADSFLAEARAALAELETKDAAPGAKKPVGKPPPVPK